MKSPTRFISITATFAIAASVSGQSAQVPAPPQTESLLIHNASVHAVSDDHPTAIDAGWVRFEDGRIVSMGEGEPPQAALAGARHIDAEGLSLVPGFISGPSQIGLLEVEQVDATDDRREGASRSPEAAAWIAVNPDSDLIPVARSGGVLHTLAMPIGGTIPGRASVLRMDGWTTEDLALVRDAGVIVSWPMAAPIRASWMRRGGASQRQSIDARLKAIDTWFDDAEAWAAARAADETTPTDLRFVAMQPVLEGERPVFIRADSRGQMETSLAWAAARGLRPVIVGGSAAAECIPLLQRTGASVILTRVHRLPPSRHHAVDRCFTVANALEAAGVPFAIGAEDEPAHEREIAHNAATAAAHGLSKEAALHAITRGPAEIIGVGDRLGSIQSGHSATFFLCEGDPLEVVNQPMRAWIDGRELDLGDRQKRLYRKYQEKYRQKGIIDG